MRLSYELNQDSVNFDSSALTSKVTNHVLQSSEINTKTNDCFAKFVNGNLVVIPIHKVFSMRTMLDHVD